MMNVVDLHVYGLKSTATEFKGIDERWSLGKGPHCARLGLGTLLL